MLHDKAPGWNCNRVQHVLNESKIDHFGKLWPGGSPDLNPAENVGTMLMEKVEERMDNSKAGDKFKRKGMVRFIKLAMAEIEKDEEFRIKLLESFIDRVIAVKYSNGGHTNY